MALSAPPRRRRRHRHENGPAVLPVFPGAGLRRVAGCSPVLQRVHRVDHRVGLLLESGSRVRVASAWVRQSLGVRSAQPRERVASWSAPGPLEERLLIIELGSAPATGWPGPDPAGFLTSASASSGAGPRLRIVATEQVERHIGVGAQNRHLRRPPGLEPPRSSGEHQQAEDQPQPTPVPPPHRLGQRALAGSGRPGRMLAAWPGIRRRLAGHPRGPPKSWVLRPPCLRKLHPSPDAPTPGSVPRARLPSGQLHPRRRPARRGGSDAAAAPNRGLAPGSRAARQPAPPKPGGGGGRAEHLGASRGGVRRATGREQRHRRPAAGGSTAPAPKTQWPPAEGRTAREEHRPAQTWVAPRRWRRRTPRSGWVPRAGRYCRRAASLASATSRRRRPPSPGRDRDGER